MGNSPSTQEPQLAHADPDGVHCAGDSDASQQADGHMHGSENVVSGAQGSGEGSGEGSVHEGLPPMASASSTFRTSRVTRLFLKPSCCH